MIKDKWFKEDLLKLEFGATYVVEVPFILPDKVKDRLYEYLVIKTQHLRCHFLILDGGIKLAKAKEFLDTETNS